MVCKRVIESLGERYQHADHFMQFLEPELARTGSAPAEDRHRSHLDQGQESGRLASEIATSSQCSTPSLTNAPAMVLEPQPARNPATTTHSQGIGPQSNTSQDTVEVMPSTMSDQSQANRTLPPLLPDPTAEDPSYSNVFELSDGFFWKDDPLSLNSYILPDDFNPYHAFFSENIGLNEDPLLFLPGGE